MTPFVSQGEACLRNKPLVSKTKHSSPEKWERQAQHMSLSKADFPDLLLLLLLFFFCSHLFIPGSTNVTEHAFICFWCPCTPPPPPPPAFPPPNPHPNDCDGMKWNQRIDDCCGQLQPDQHVVHRFVSFFSLLLFSLLSKWQCGSGPSRSMMTLNRMRIKKMIKVRIMIIVIVTDGVRCGMLFSFCRARWHNRRKNITWQA